MFTGLVRATAEITARERGTAGTIKLRLQSKSFSKLALEVGDSLAVDGVCLTVVETGAESVAVELAETTSAKTTLQQARAGCIVNIEPSLAVGDRLDGHYVSGHVDGVVKIIVLEKSDAGYRLVTDYPGDLRPFLAPRGSVALDGISLTIADVSEETLTVQVVPHTYQKTTLAERRPGQQMNLEVDTIARYLYNFWQNEKKKDNLSLSELSRAFQR